MAVFVSDSFTASGGAQGSPGDNLTAHTGEIGATWTDIHGGAWAALMLTAAGRVRPAYSASAFYADYLASGVPPSPDYYVQATLYQATALNTQQFVIRARWNTATDSGYYVAYDREVGQLFWFRRVSATDLQLGQYVVALSDGGSLVLRLELVGASLSLFVGGVLLETVTNSDVPAAGAVGISAFISVAGSDATGFHLDDFSAGTLGAEPGLVPRPQSRWRSVRR